MGGPSFGDMLVEVLPQMRADAESLMRDTVRVERVTGTTTATTPPYGTIETFETVYSGKGKFQSDKTYEIVTAVGESMRTSSRGSLHVPVAAFSAEAGMRVTLTASLDQPENVGAVMRIAERMPLKTLRTADRHNLEGEQEAAS